ncbi:MAG: M48 family metallopeptidase [Phenylobacterium sp.]|uniref:M48 family metallopeptidase n=1 Tax=Phenylobacterium sp. TaxID=1871053 RepID=UPI0025DC7462|nr:SprT family zinc-dependent metalloprotease [Phenylobacterium sp.]MCA3757314.1 M48 family metallopeptidase [Phenylobacterium sp.]
MSVERLLVDYGDQQIAVSVVRRARRTLEIAVEPDATVSVAAPHGASVASIEIKVRRRGAWIRRQQRYFQQFLPRTPERQFVAGETLRYLGRQYRLKIQPHIEQEAKLQRGYLVIRTTQPGSADVTRNMVDDWYRMRAGAKFLERLEFNLQRFPDPELFRPSGLLIRKVGQRWGSMSPRRRLLLNVRLIEAPIDAIDYVITHELCHIAEPHHGPKFLELLQRVLPDWESRKLKLERSMS